MLHKKLLNPSSIAVIGGSDHIDHIGGSVLKNLIDQGFKGQLYVVNPKKDKVQGIMSYRDVRLIPKTDLAIIAIPAEDIFPVVKELVSKKGTKGFIIFSAGFSELDKSGAHLEHEITSLIKDSGGSLLGPNNIGMINEYFAGVFTRPIPIMDKNGVDFISASGATAVFTLEAAEQIGLRLTSLFSVGNGPQIGVEEVLEHLDKTFVPGKSSLVKLLYLEGIKHPSKLLEHALSLRQKGCTLVALKSGITEKGNAAASSHTGAIANSDHFVQALFDKAGILRCKSRYELITLGAILQTTRIKPNNFAIITHAGGPGVILTDTLTENGLSVPDLSEHHQKSIKEFLFKGAATENPIDILATGNSMQLEQVITYCEEEVEEIDAMIVVFGSPGLGTVSKAYQVIHDLGKICRKPIFAILPSVVNVKEDIKNFIKKGNVAFSDEYLFAKSLAQAVNRKEVTFESVKKSTKKQELIKSLVKLYPEGFLEPEQAYELMKSAGIKMAGQVVVKDENQLLYASEKLGYPLVQKVIGPLHKSDIKGVIVNVSNDVQLAENFKNLMGIDGASGVLAQEMVKGKEVFIGAKREAGFPPLIMFGAGGVYIEILKDYQSILAPVSKEEAKILTNKLKIKPILEGVRGEAPCDLESFYDLIQKVGSLMLQAPEITELDLNPLMISPQGTTAVDVRVKIDRSQNTPTSPLPSEVSLPK